MRDKHACGPVVQCREQVTGLGDAHEPGDPAGAGAQAMPGRCCRGRTARAPRRSRRSRVRRCRESPWCGGPGVLTKVPSSTSPPRNRRRNSAGDERGGSVDIGEGSPQSCSEQRNIVLRSTKIAPNGVPCQPDEDRRPAVPRTNGPHEEGVQSVVLALRVIEHVTEMRRPVGVTALATALGMNKSRIHRHLQTLVARAISPGRRRPSATGLDRASSARPPHRRQSRSRRRRHAGAARLARLLGHFSVLSQIEQDGVRVLAAVSGRSQVEIGVKRGSLLTLPRLGTGQDRARVRPTRPGDRVLRSRLEMLTPSTIVGATAAREGA